MAIAHVLTAERDTTLDQAFARGQITQRDGGAAAAVVNLGAGQGQRAWCDGHIPDHFNTIGQKPANISGGAA